MRKSYTVRDYKAIVEFCKTPKNIKEICAEFGFIHRSVYPHIAIRMAELMIETRVKCKAIKTYYQSKKGITDQQIKELFARENKNKSHQGSRYLIESDEPVYDTPRIDRLREGFDMADLYKDIGIVPKDKSSIKDKGVVVQVAPGHVRVNGLGGYHSGKIDRARQKVSVGCSAEII